MIKPIHVQGSIDAILKPAFYQLLLRYCQHTGTLGSMGGLQSFLAIDKRMLEVTVCAVGPNPRDIYTGKWGGNTEKADCKEKKASRGYPSFSRPLLRNGTVEMMNTSEGRCGNRLAREKLQEQGTSAG